ncbi:DnaJ domain-containing protein [Elizabethkingia miricola]|uniref:J domain-containing protein n=1 Tax=Elizabethkingia miricola TaxID=172045 RepID=UPI002018C1D5|nr:J domain-containing protein [Elizabethkingia miricola]MCL1653826.1 DnaJ domain-containing protein [Elizabethkingia miricola]
MINHYKVLGVSEKATLYEIKQAYRFLAKKYHPDNNKSDNANLVFLKVKNSYDVLINEKSRLEHDILLKAYIEVTSNNEANKGNCTNVADNDQNSYKLNYRNLFSRKNIIQFFSIVASFIFFIWIYDLFLGINKRSDLYKHFKNDSKKEKDIAIDSLKTDTVRFYKNGELKF